MKNPVHQIQEAAYKDFSLVGLKVAIILVALFLIVLALTVNNKWLLAGVLAYEVFP